jgi:hypothetical protein
MTWFGPFGWWLACAASLAFMIIATRNAAAAERNYRAAQVLLDEIKRWTAMINVTCKNGHPSSHAISDVVRNDGATCPTCDERVLETRETT